MRLGEVSRKAYIGVWDGSRRSLFLVVRRKGWMAVESRQPVKGCIGFGDPSTKCGVVAVLGIFRDTNLYLAKVMS